MIELISLHIPKAAGTSFRHVLSAVYGHRLALHYGNRQSVDVSTAAAVHGHLKIGDYAARFPEATTVTWLRNPVERIISYYFYWVRTPARGNPNHQAVLDNELSLVEFAELPPVRRELGVYLEGYPIDRFSFVGVVEDFDRDLRRFADRMGWRPPRHFHENTAPSLPRVSRKVRRKLALLYREELALYQRFARDAS